MNFIELLKKANNGCAESIDIIQKISPDEFAKIINDKIIEYIYETLCPLLFDFTIDKFDSHSLSWSMSTLGKIYYNGTRVNKDYVLAKKLFEKSAELGNCQALNCLACIYADGDGVEKNEQLAIDLFQRSIQAGGYFAISNLAITYGNKKNYHLAIEFYEKAIKAGNYSVARYLGDIYVKGKGVEKNINRAIKLYEKAIGLDDGSSANNLGLIYKNGNGVEKNINKAIELYEKAITLGNKYACNNLARMYEYGTDVEKNIDKAIELYEKSIELGSNTALIGLVRSYKKKQNIPNIPKVIELCKQIIENNNTPALKDAIILLRSMTTDDKITAMECRNIINILRKASESGNICAIDNLVEILMVGGGKIKKNILEAIKICKRILKKKSANPHERLNAVQKLGCIYAKEYKKFTKAKKFFEIGMEMNDAISIGNLAILYDTGEGVQQDYLKAKQLYELSIEHGLVGANFPLGQLYYFGKGVEKNITQAIKFIKKSVRDNKCEQFEFLKNAYIKNNLWIDLCFLHLKYDEKRVFKQVFGENITNEIYNEKKFRKLISHPKFYLRFNNNIPPIIRLLNNSFSAHIDPLYLDNEYDLTPLECIKAKKDFLDQVYNRQNNLVHDK